MKISGTVHLNSGSENRYQFIYGSMYDGAFVSLYAKFTLNKNKLSGLSLMCHNYSEQNYLINNATLASSHEKKNGGEVETNESNVVDINCLTLIVDLIKDKGEKEVDVDTHNVQLESNSYFEVLRKEDEGGRLEKMGLKSILECREFPITINKEGNMSPGKMCPRGYSAIIL